MTSRGTPVKYLSFDNAGEHQSKFQKVWEKEKIMVYYTTPHTTKLNGVIEIKFAFIKEEALTILFNLKLNDTA